MDTTDQHLEAIGDIRSMMEQSSRFISLSGLSGVFAGIFALLGAMAAYWYLDLGWNAAYYSYAYSSNGAINPDFFTFFAIDGLLVLSASLLVCVFLTTRNARKKGLSIWGTTAKRLLFNLFIPLVAGGFFCLILLKQGEVGLVAPATLIFYGLALINASKYTLNDIRYLGVCQIILGLTAGVFIGYGLLFWALGFGVLHIVYGVVMYVKYEK